MEPNDGTTTTIDGDTQLTVIRHKVKSGETLSKIARHYGVSTASIKKWNNLRSNRILRGQQLKIHVYEKVSRKEEPEVETATTETTTTPAVAQAETPEAASVETQETASVETPAEAPEKNQPENPTYHTVSRGETLGSIADDYRVSLSDLREWNNISGNTIYAGQRLFDRRHARAENKKNDNFRPHREIRRKLVDYRRTLRCDSCKPSRVEQPDERQIERGRQIEHQRRGFVLAGKQRESHNPQGAPRRNAWLHRRTLWRDRCRPPTLEQPIGHSN